MESPSVISVRIHASTQAISFAVLALGLLSSVGCNNGRQLQTDLYQRELRLQEDKIYQLQDCVGEYQAIIRDYRAEVSDLRSDEAVDGSGVDSATGSAAGSQSIMPLESSTGSGLKLLAPTPAKVKFRSPKKAPASETILGDSASEAPAFEGEAPDFDAMFEELPDAAKEAGEAPLFTPQSYEQTPADEASQVVSAIDLQQIDDQATASDIVVPSLPPLTPINETPITETSAAESLEVIQPELVELEATAAAEALMPAPALQETTLQGIMRVQRKGLQKAVSEVRYVTPKFELRNGSPEPTGEATLLATLRMFTEIDLNRFDGDLSFLLTDARVISESKKLARWDFSANEVRQAWQRQQQQSRLSHPRKAKAVELPLLLPNRLPTDRSLEMWVRVVESSGKKHLEKIDAEFLSNPLRLINAEPLAVDDVSKQELEQRRLQADRLMSNAEDTALASQANYELVVE